MLGSKFNEDIFWTWYNNLVVSDVFDAQMVKRKFLGKLDT